jgi:hypothetical protein
MVVRDTKQSTQITNIMQHKKSKQHMVMELVKTLFLTNRKRVREVLDLPLLMQCG